MTYKVSEFASNEAIREARFRNWLGWSSWAFCVSYLRSIYLLVIIVLRFFIASVCPPHLQDV